MSFTGDNIPSWQITNGWREVFARIFAEVETKLNVTPEWLINPATKRRLKLDMLYPDLGVAVRIEGVEIKQHRRFSLEEEDQQRTRDDARVEVCRAHEIDLIVVELAAETPKPVFQEIDLRLSRAAQRVKSPELQAILSRSRATAAALARKLQSYKDFKLYADLWQDRQYQPALSPFPTAPVKQTVTFTSGMEVEHTNFGPGVVIATSHSGNDTLITVDFITAGQKTLAASLVGDKLRPR